MSETINRLSQQSAYEADADFCVENSPQFVDSVCSRIPYYSSRWAMLVRPVSSIKNVIDFNTSATARLIYNLKKIGVRFEKDKPFFYKVGYGHINLRIDGIINSGIPDFPSDSGLLFVRRVNKVQFKSAKNGEIPSEVYNAANLLMAYGNYKKSFIFFICDSSGDLFLHTVDINFRTAEKILAVTEEGVSSNLIPVRFEGYQEKHGNTTIISDKCNNCAFCTYCLLPQTPPPSCRTCVHFVIGDNGYAACGAQNNFTLTNEMQCNLHECEMHIYKPDFLESWADCKGYATREVIGQDDIVNIPVGYLYVNKLTGQEFINCPEKEMQGYTSYEISKAEGMELIGDKDIEKIRSMFDAKIKDL